MNRRGAIAGIIALLSVPLAKQLAVFKPQDTKFDTALWKREFESWTEKMRMNPAEIRRAIEDDRIKSYCIRDLLWRG